MISVVMAAKNYAAFVAQAIQSVRAQTVADWELVVVDDGSVDGTAAVVRPYLADGRIRLVESDRLGQSRAKNLGARLARGEWLAYLDADDAWHPTKLERQMAALAADPGAGLCYTRRTLIGPDGLALAKQPAPAALPSGDILAAVYAKNFVCFSSVVIRRELFEAVGGFDPALDLAIDYDLWLRLARHTRAAGVDEPLVLYRTGHGNLSAKLTDRVRTSEVIKNRAIRRRNLGERVPERVLNEGYASTFRQLAYTLRRSEPTSAARWYWRALLKRGSAKRESLRGLAASALAVVRPRVGGGGVNAAVNR